MPQRRRCMTMTSAFGTLPPTRKGLSKPGTSEARDAGAKRQSRVPTTLKGWSPCPSYGGFCR
jgi:hypothetical protein